MKFLTLAVIIGVLGCSKGNLSGPYLFWGYEKLQNLKVSALTEVDEQSLTTLFTEVKAIVIFVRNSTCRMDGLNYPNFRHMISKNFWSYLPQRTLAVDPANYNTNVEVVNLVGSPAQQDNEITGLFKDSSTIYGEGEVLGILAYREEEVHYMYKREASEPAEEEPTVSNFVYRAPGKALMYTTSAPILNLEISGKHHSYALLEHDRESTFDDRTDWSRLNIGFKVNNTRLRLRFNFTMSATKYWSLSSVEVEYKEYHNVMPLVGHEVVAPKGFSYRCSTRSLFFRNEKDNLTLVDFQIQPWLMGVSRFSDAYDCVGFTTAPIWSGLFVSAILVGLLFVGILALMDIKPPNRFESSRSKQLTFTVQD